MTCLLGAVFAPGFFASAPVRDALIVGGVVAGVSAVVGVFAVLRGSAFAGHALSDLGATGGSAAFLVGVGPLWGFLAAGLVASSGIEAIGSERMRGRDLATGIVLGAGLGLAALFLYLASVSTTATGAVTTVLFGSLFSLDPATVPAVVALAAVALALVVLLGRPLLLTSLSPELASARGIPVRAVSLGYSVAIALSVALTALTIGAILGTALLIGPAASALRLARRPGQAMLVAVVAGVATTWLGVVLAYDSYSWPPAGRGWPVSFFVVTAVLVVYVASGLVARTRGEGR